MKLKDFVTKKINTRNHQISFDIKKRELKKNGINIEDLMKLDISKIKNRSKSNFENCFDKI